MIEFGRNIDVIFHAKKITEDAPPSLDHHTFLKRAHSLVIRLKGKFLFLVTLTIHSPTFRKT